MGIFADIARTGDPVFRTIFRNGLGDGQDMRFVEVVARRAAAMARGAEFYRMLRITDFRLQHVVLSSQLGDVNQITLLRRLPRTFIDCHCLNLLVQMLKS